MGMEVAKKNRNRYATDPIYNEQGSLRGTPAHLLKPLQLEILKALAYDRFLSWDYIQKLVGSHRSHLLSTLEVMRSKPYQYVKVCDEQSESSRRRMYQNIKSQYELTDLGKQTVFDTFGIRTYTGKKVSFIAHQIMADHAMASLRIGAKESNGRFELRSADQLLKSEKMPESTKASDTPFLIPLGDKVLSEKGKLVDHAIRPDREIFTLLDYEKDLSYFFGGFEVGTGTETHMPKDGRHDHSYTQSKFKDYIDIIERGIYDTYYAAPNFHMLFIEPNIHRIENMMAIWKTMTTEKEWVREYVWFKTFPPFTDKYEASGRMLTELFHLVGEDGATTTFSLL